MKIILIICFVLINSSSFSQNINAITENGDTVILKTDGTWEYIKSETSTNELTDYSIPKSSTKVLSLKGNKINISYNPELWKEDGKDDPSRITLTHKDGDVYGVIIYERVEMELESLKNLALINARNADPNVKVTFKEERIVNGTRVFCMKMEGKIESINFIYYGYYYSSEAGTLQLLTYTYKNLFSDYESDMTDFLNGLSIKY